MADQFYENGKVYKSLIVHLRIVDRDGRWYVDDFWILVKVSPITTKQKIGFEQLVMLSNVQHQEIYDEVVGWVDKLTQQELEDGMELEETEE